jgi:predicted nucleic acid-binding protein
VFLIALMLCSGIEPLLRISRCRNISCSCSSKRPIDQLLTKSLIAQAGELADPSVLMTSMPSSVRIVIVTDAGVLVAIFVDDGRWGEAARARVRDEDLAAPELIDLEVTSALRGLLRVGKVNEFRARLALADLRHLPLQRASHKGLVTRCWELRDNFSAYDASYIALAEMLSATLITTDARMSRAPQSICRVEVLSSH